MRKTCLCVALLCAAASAQVGQAGALGRFLKDPKLPNGGHKIDVQAATQNNGGLGCASAVVGGKRFYYVSARGRSNGQPNLIYKFDENGKLVKTINQPLTRGATSAGNSPWGIRDLAWNGGKYVYGGAEATATSNTVYALDVTTDTFDANAAWKCPSTATNCRALAYDPNGDNGKGSMWSANFSAAVVEFDKTGKVLRTVPANNLVSAGQTASFYGAGYDPDRKTVWFFGQGGSSKGRSAATGVRVVAFEVSTGNPIAPTGLVVFGDQTIPSSNSATIPPGGVAGGAEFYIKNGKPTLLMLAQAGSDTIYEIFGRFNFGKNCGGTIGFKGDAPYGGNANWELTLSNSKFTSGLGAVVLALNDLSIPTAPGGIFANGCFTHWNLLQTFVVVGTAPIASNAASLKLPVPTGVTGELVFQWVETPVPLATPLYTTDGGKAKFYN